MGDTVEHLWVYDGLCAVDVNDTRVILSIIYTVNVMGTSCEWSMFVLHDENTPLKWIVKGKWSYMWKDVKGCTYKKGAICYDGWQVRVVLYVKCVQVMWTEYVTWIDMLESINCDAC